MPKKSAFQEIVSKKWHFQIIDTLGNKPHRFNELRRCMPKISQRVLTKALRDLEYDGLIKREVFSTKPPAVEYSLTCMGKSLLVPLNELMSWSEKHHHKIQTSRERSMEHRNG